VVVSLFVNKSVIQSLPAKRGAITTGKHLIPTKVTLFSLKTVLS